MLRIIFLSSFLLFIAHSSFAQLKVEGKAIIGGTTLPADEFQVNGDMQLRDNSPFLRLQSTGTTNGGLVWKNSSGFDVGAFFLRQNDGRFYLDVNDFSASGSGAEFVFDGNGDFGIGTIDPLAPLHVSRPITELARFESTAASKWIAFYQSGVRKGILWNAGNNMVLRSDEAGSNIQFQTAGTTRLLIEDDGDLLARTTTRRATFTFAHPTGAGSDTGFTIYNNSTNNNYWNLYTVNLNGDFELFQNGVFKGRFLSSDGTYTPTSDRKYKRDIQTMDGVLNRILELRPRTYRMKSDRSGAERIGFIAQEVEEVFPQMVYLGPVGDTEEQAYTMNYGAMAVVAIKGIQELVAKEDKLEAQQELIEAEVANLRSENESLRKEMSTMARELQDLKEILREVARTQESCRQLLNQSGQAEQLTPAQLIPETRAELKQNVPNPFLNETRIGYVIPEGSQQAYLSITDISGRELQRLDVSGVGSGEVILNVRELPAGTYAYSLFIDGQRIGTRQMILGKH